MRGRWEPHVVMRGLIGINIVMYVLSLLLDPATSRGAASALGMLAPSNRSLLLLGATGTVPIDELHRWWTLISASYLHGGLLHLAFNMLALYQLGPFMAREYGISRLIVLYTLTGIVGFAVSYWAGVPLTIGASAAVCGLIGATLYYGKSRGGIYGQLVYRQVGGWAVAIFVFGFLIPGINNWGHAGGMAAGALLGYLLGYQERLREQLWHHVLASACVVLTVLVLAWAIVLSATYRFSV